MRSIGRLLGIALVGAALAGLPACASGGAAGTSSEAERADREFDTWSALFRHHIPRATIRGECIRNIGRGQAPPPVIEIDGQRTYDGCPPPGYEPEDIERIEMLDASEAGMLLGSRGEGGMVRMYTR